MWFTEWLWPWWQILEWFNFQIIWRWPIALEPGVLLNCSSHNIPPATWCQCHPASLLLRPWPCWRMCGWAAINKMRVISEITTRITRSFHFVCVLLFTNGRDRSETSVHVHSMAPSRLRIVHAPPNICLFCARLATVAMRDRKLAASFGACNVLNSLKHWLTA